jgi:hypothetical protein
LEGIAFRSLIPSKGGDKNPIMSPMKAGQDVAPEVVAAIVAAVAASLGQPAEELAWGKITPLVNGHRPNQYWSRLGRVQLMFSREDRRSFQGRVAR